MTPRLASGPADGRAGYLVGLGYDDWGPGGVVEALSGPNLWEAGARRVPADIALPAAWDAVHRAFDRLVPLAEHEGVGLAFEACWGTLCDDFFTTADLLARYDSPAFGINLTPSPH